MFQHRCFLPCYRCGVLCAAGITGGFAGGERGVQQFVEKGELKLATPGKGEAQACKAAAPTWHAEPSLHIMP